MMTIKAKSVILLIKIKIKIKKSLTEEKKKEVRPVVPKVEVDREIGIENTNMKKKTKEIKVEVKAKVGKEIKEEAGTAGMI